MENDFFIIRWARFFITRYRISILMMIAIIIAGLWCVRYNQRQDFPSIPINIVIVTATYPGASPTDVEQEVIIPIEQSAGAFDEVDYVQTTSQNSFGAVEIYTKNTGDINAVATKLSDEQPKLALPDNANIEIQTIDSTGAYSNGSAISFNRCISRIGTDRQYSEYDFGLGDNSSGRNSG